MTKEGGKRNAETGGGQGSLRDLGAAISALYPQSLGKDEAYEAARNLSGFCELLLEIENENKRGKRNGRNGSADSLHQA